MHPPSEHEKLQENQIKTNMRNNFMNQGSSLKQIVCVEWMRTSVFKPELAHCDSQRPSQGTPSSESSVWLHEVFKSSSIQSHSYITVLSKHCVMGH